MSGFKVNFSVNNQLATPSIHAAALANRPAAGQVGRVFIDTDNPSTGMYRDTGTVWVQIAQNGGGSATLQTVTDAGNTTDNNILLTYADNTLANALVFYNDQLAQEEYLIEKRGTGITTNDSLVIQSRGNIAPSTNPAGIMIDGANDVIKTFYTTAYTEQGLKLDFANNNYLLGQQDFGVDINFGTGIIKIGDVNGSYGGYTWLNFDENNGTISTFAGGGEIGLKLDFANNVYYLGDYNYNSNGLQLSIDNNTNQIYLSNFQQFGLIIDNNVKQVILGDTTGSAGNYTTLFLDDTNNLIKTTNNGNDKGLKLDFANDIYSLGDLANNIGAKVDIGNGEYFFGNYGAGSFLYSIGYQIFIGDSLSAANGTYLMIDDNNQRLEVSGNLASGTAGGSSGQHLKIRVGGVDYKIALLNP